MSGSARRRSTATSRHSNPVRPVLVLPDQLHPELGALHRARQATDAACVFLVESRPWLARRPYHRQRLATIMVAMRHFACEEEARGSAVFLVRTDERFGDAVRRLAEEHGPMAVTEPAEREMRAELAALVGRGLLEVVPHDGWLTTADEFARACPRPPYRMDAFYRHIRRTHDLLMDDDGRPLGGKLSHDADNRKPWRGEPAAPEPPRFPIDDIRQEVAALIEDEFSHHPGTLDLETVPGCVDEVEALWSWAQRECLTHFGPYEDAMSGRSRGLFHTRISAVMNLHRLLPRRVLDDALALDLPLASKEGFVRQVIGWREFVRHVHMATDGFRTIGDESTALATPTTGRVGDGGYARWTGAAWPAADDDDSIDAGAAPDALDAGLPLPPAYWGVPSGLACLDRVVDAVWAEGWSHHITRLMVLGNIATLLGVSPRELTDWFWAAYIDSWDWVVEPNVLGMATFALGEMMTTKPYVSGAAYIDRMSDHCASCAFDPKRSCPLTRLYWAFLERNRERFEENPRMAARMGVVLKALAKRSAEERRTDRETFVHVREVLIRGEPVDAGGSLFARASRT